MSGLNETDIRLSEEWQLTQAADGDAPLCTGAECFRQGLILEALTQKGSLFFDPDFGWSLYDFLNAEDDTLTRLEIIQRARLGLQGHPEVLPESIEIFVSLPDDIFQLRCSYQLTGAEEPQELNLVIDPVRMEVTAID